MLVAISGSQGSGKSTVLQELETLGFNTIKRKTSRSILKDWNISLAEVNSDPTLTTRFQDEIIKRKANDEVGAVKSKELYFTERTYADLFTYSLVALGNNNLFDVWLNKYYNLCLKHCQTYSQIFYLTAGFFNPAADGVRGSNIHYSRMVDLTMLDITTDMVPNYKLSVIKKSDLEQRVNLIMHQTNHLNR